MQVAARILSGGGEDQQPPLQREPPWIEFQRRLTEALLVSCPRNLRAKTLELFQDRICSRSPAERS